MGMAAIVGIRGHVYIIGAAIVSAARCQVVELQAAVGMFLRALRQHPWVHVDDFKMAVLAALFFVGLRRPDPYPK